MKAHVKLLALPVVTGLLLLAGCKLIGVDPPAPYGHYDYTGFDSTGTRIVQGRLLLIEPTRDDGAFAGSWHLNQVGNPDRIGPQVGTGRLIGTHEGDRLFIELNPEMADNNVGLAGTLTGDSLRGNWTYSGFPGPLNHGTFMAVRR